MSGENQKIRIYQAFFLEKKFSAFILGNTLINSVWQILVLNILAGICKKLQNCFLLSGEGSQLLLKV